MASISSLKSLSPQQHNNLHHFTAQPKKSNLSDRKCHVVCSISKEQHSQTTNDELQRYGGGAKRREIVLQTALSAFYFQGVASNAFAETAVLEGYQEYVDDVNKFKISIPQDWQVGTAEANGFKSVTAFYPKGDTSSNVSVAITGIGPDFTKMGSFGKVEEFAESLVNGLDRSWQRPPGVAAKLVSCRDSKGFYYIEYSLQNPGESRRHIFSAVGMASNGWYNRLYTVTGQFIEEESNKYSSEIEKAVSSFRFI